MQPETKEPPINHAPVTHASMNHENHEQGVFIKPSLHPWVQELVESNASLLKQMKGLHEGPVHLIFPQIMAENIKNMQTYFQELDYETLIYYT